ncbi:MAG: AAA family ATPase, partial [Acidimicrobiia bacterium]|nr:AAA family ATPase [Acidimicrobiia bacterium]
MTSPNPFAPTFGASPPLLAGRDKPIHNITTALESGPNHPDRTVIFTGMRGSGKTVLLNEVEDRAQQKGWIAISHDASTPGFVDRVARDTDRELEELEGPPPIKRLSGVEAGGFGVEFENVPPEPRTLDLRHSLTELTNRLVQHSTGVLITIDELQNADRTEARVLGSVIQHVARRQAKPVAFVGAALPSIEDTILADQAITFFQRCSRYEIGPLDPTATRAALVVPINDQGGFITTDALNLAVKESRGYPFVVQLIGFHMWELADGQEITQEVAVSAIDEANNRFATAIMGPTWRQLSKA